MTFALAGIIFGLFAKGWIPLLAASASTAAFVSWWRLFFAIQRLRGDGAGPQLIRDARNIALCTGAPDDQAEARRILETRELPHVGFFAYVSGFWFELVPTVIVASIVYALRLFVL